MQRIRQLSGWAAISGLKGGLFLLQQHHPADKAAALNPVGSEVDARGGTAAAPVLAIPTGHEQASCTVQFGFDAG